MKYLQTVFPQAKRKKSGVPIDKIRAAGGIARKDEMMMQIYADVTGKEIRISTTTQGGALGSAMYAAVAAGIYKDICDASDAMAAGYDKVYYPDAESKAVYDKIYAEYAELHDYFGRGGNDVMKRLLKYSV